MGARLSGRGSPLLLDRNSWNAGAESRPCRARAVRAGPGSSRGRTAHSRGSRPGRLGQLAAKQNSPRRRIRGGQDSGPPADALGLAAGVLEKPQKRPCAALRAAPVPQRPRGGRPPHGRSLNPHRATGIREFESARTPVRRRLRRRAAGNLRPAAAHGSASSPWTSRTLHRQQRHRGPGCFLSRMGGEGSRRAGQHASPRAVPITGPSASPSSA